MVILGVLTARGIDGLRGVCPMPVEVGPGRAEWRLSFAAVPLEAVLPPPATLLRLLVSCIMVWLLMLAVLPLVLPFDMITDEAGELPGVPMLRPAGLSRVSMLETESRSCRLLSSSNSASMACTLACSASNLAVRSARSRIISPLTVSLSLMPFWMIESTRSIADP